MTCSARQVGVPTTTSEARQVGVVYEEDVGLDTTDRDFHSHSGFSVVQGELKEVHRVASLGRDPAIHPSSKLASNSCHILRARVREARCMSGTGPDTDVVQGDRARAGRLVV